MASQRKVATSITKLIFTFLWTSSVRVFRVELRVFIWHPESSFRRLWLVSQFLLFCCYPIAPSEDCSGADVGCQFLTQAPMRPALLFLADSMFLLFLFFDCIELRLFPTIWAVGGVGAHHLPQCIVPALEWRWVFWIKRIPLFYGLLCKIKY